MSININPTVKDLMGLGMPGPLAERVTKIPDFTSRSTTAEHAVGAEAWDPETNTLYKYLLAGGGLTQNKAILYDQTNATANLTTTAAGAAPQGVCVPQGSNVGSGEYAWMAIAGVITVSLLASCAADVKLYTTATGGSLDDNASGTVLVPGAFSTATVGGSAADTVIHALKPMMVNVV